jgi:colicin import membrane protein
MSYFKENKKGLLGTIVFHAVLIVVLLVFGFRTPLPLPGEEGILINFGNTDSGSGDIEPQKSSPPPEPEVQQEQNQALPEPVVEEAKDAVDEVVTQDFEEAASVEKKKEVPKKPEKTPEQIEQERLENERIELERLAEIERKRIEEEKRLEKERLAKQAEEINQRIGNAFAKGKEGDSSSQGIDSGEGNQGKETGSLDSDNYGDGDGLGDKGISYSLAGRKAVYMPKIEDRSQKEGKVVVDIKVGSNGDVVWANAGVRGSTSQDPYLVKLAKDAALKVRFNTKPNAPDQVGTITITFVLE